MTPADLIAALRALPKAELHLHLEGTIRPHTAVELAACYGVSLTEDEAKQRYQYADFNGFIDAFKWVTSFLRQPADYALIARRMAEELMAQNVVYAEVTIALGVLLWRNQPAEPIFEALWSVAQEFEAQGLTLRWIPDGTWQFGSEAAMSAAKIAAVLRHLGVIAFGMGGDEMALPYRSFRPVYDYVASRGLRRVAHAGEVGPPQHVRDAIELLGAERIGHGIAAMHDPALAEVLTARRIALEVCPTSNLCTGALTKQLAKTRATLAEHPLKALFGAGVPITLSTDDPAMFHTDLLSEYGHCVSLGLSAGDVLRLAESSFAHSFLPPDQKAAFLRRFHASGKAQGLHRT